jgi:hypothetical protein
MKPAAAPPTQETLAGLVERVTFHNAENGFCALRTKARGHRELVTVVGHSATIAAGEWITATGEWVNDRTHGQQFKARFLRTSAPTPTEGIEKYLSSGMIRGIGPIYARKLVRSFAERVFDVIEAEPDRLREVDGIGPVRGLGSDGMPVALWIRVSGNDALEGSPLIEFAHQLLRGFHLFPYGVPNLRVEVNTMKTFVPCSTWRSTGTYANVFYLESFIEEMARAAKKDPIEYRRAEREHSDPGNHGHLPSCNDPPVQPESCVLIRSSGRHDAPGFGQHGKDAAWTVSLAHV